MARATPYWLIRAKALDGKLDRSSAPVSATFKDTCPHCRRPIDPAASRERTAKSGTYHAACWRQLLHLLGEAPMA